MTQRADLSNRLNEMLDRRLRDLIESHPTPLVLLADDGTVFRYLHMQRASYPVGVGATVQKGGRLGKTSNEFGGTPTTIHLHYDIHQYVAQLQQAVYVPPYLSLVRSYQELLGQPGVSCEDLPLEGGVVDDASPCFQRWGPVQYWRAVQGQGVAGQAGHVAGHAGGTGTASRQCKGDAQRKGQIRPQGRCV